MYNYDSADIDFVLEGLEIDELKPLLLARIAAFARPDKEELLTRHHRPELLEEAVAMYVEVKERRRSEKIAQSIILPKCRMFKADHVRRISTRRSRTSAFPKQQEHRRSSGKCSSGQPICMAKPRMPGSTL